MRPIQFAMLASGSRGNSALIHAGGAGLLVDIGLGPRRLAKRLASVGFTWHRVACVLLTHTHGDHVHEATLQWMARHGVVLVCHEGHRALLRRLAGFRALESRGLIRCYEEQPFLAPNGLRVEPVSLVHDGGPTYGFRIEGCVERRGRRIALGYIADTGTWTARMAEAVADVDLLALEFNHDEQLQRHSGRPPALIARVLGDRGHLSNTQAAELVGAVLQLSKPRTLRQLVLLHLSRDCNAPELALNAARAAVRSSGRRIAVHAAEQEWAFPDVPVPLPRRPESSKPAGTGEDGGRPVLAACHTG